MSENEVEVYEPEVITGSALMVLEKAAIDMQIVTAKTYPRSIVEFQRDSTDLATQDEEVAESCLYSRPVGGGKNAEGMSIRMAEIVSACYGNLISGARIIEQTDRYVIAQGVCHDLQKNVRKSAEHKESTVDKNGKPYSERQRALMASVACAKAERNAIFKVVPRALCKPVEKAVRDMLFGDGKSLEKRRELATGWIKKLGIDPQRVLVAIGVTEFKEICGKHLEILSGLKNAIKDGDTTIDEAFPVIMSEDGTDIIPVAKPQEVKAEKPAEKVDNGQLL